MSKFIKFRPTEITSMAGIGTGRYKVEGLLKKDNKTYWVPITVSNNLPKNKAREIADDMNKRKNEINTSFADKLIEQELSTDAKEKT